MALSHSTRVNILIGNGHFLSHFYVLCLPPMFLSWQSAFDVSFAQLGMTMMLMSGTTALLQTPVGFMVDRYGARQFLIGGALLMSLSIACMGLATSFWQILLLAVTSGMGNSVIHPADYAILSGSVDKERMGRSFALHTFSGNLGFASGPPVTALLIATIGWREALLTVGLVGVPVVLSILLQSRILKDQTRAEPKAAGASLSGWQLLSSRTMLLFFLFFMFGAMAGGGVQAWLVTVLHTVKGIELGVAATALTAYMIGSTAGVLVGGWIADSLKQHILTWVIALTSLSAFTILMVNWLPLPGLGVVAAVFVSGLALGGEPDATRRHAEGRGPAGADRQGVRVRQRGAAAGQRGDAGAVRVPDRSRDGASRAGSGGGDFDGEPVLRGIGTGVGPRAGGARGGGVRGRTRSCRARSGIHVYARLK